MEERYSLFEETGVSNIKQYNEEALDNGKDKMPYIVLICDEFADLMDTNRKCSEPVVRSFDPHAFLVIQEGVQVDGNFPRKLS